MVSIDLFTEKKMYDSSCMRYNEHHKVTLRRYIDRKVDYYSRAEKMTEYTYQYPSIGTHIIKDQMLAEKDKIRHIIEFIGGSPNQQSKSAIALLIGDADRGKTAFMYTLMEWLHKYMEAGAIAKRPIVAVKDEVPPEAPDYIHFVMEYSDSPPNSIIFYDEAGMLLGARDAMTRRNKETMYDLAIRRHKGWSIIYATQHTNFTDINIVRMASCFFWKKISWEEANKAERNRTTDFLLKYIDALMPARKCDNLFFDGERWLTFTNPLPTFWTENLSKGFCLLGMKEAMKLAGIMVARKDAKQVYRYLHVRCPEITLDDIEGIIPKKPKK